MADAQDLTQAFFAKVLRGNFFAGAQSDDGRMRTYLLTAFTRHMADEWDKSQAKKRGGGLEILSLDFDDGERRFMDEPVAEGAHERTFERAWARSVLEQAGAQLEKECISAGKAELFAALSPLITGDGEASAYEAISARTNISSDSLRQNVRRLRLRFRELLRVVIADTLTEPTEEQIQAELLALRAALTA
jgi:RNA polymerase sigma-70 factor (ECF subfamily)